MILIKPRVSLVTTLSEIESLVTLEIAGRNCYKSERHLGGHEDAVRFVRKIMERGHDSVLEHVSFTVRVVCDRGVSHEIVRHRIASYSQESTRYCDYAKGQLTFIIPPWVHIAEGEYTLEHMCASFAPELSIGDNVWFQSMAEAEQSYLGARNAGWKPEEARTVLPNSLKTEIVMTMNVRSWRNFFKLRTAKAAHPQMREVAWMLLNLLHNNTPVLFEDLMTKEEAK